MILPFTDARCRRVQVMEHGKERQTNTTLQTFYFRPRAPLTRAPFCGLNPPANRCPSVETPPCSGVETPPRLPPAAPTVFYFSFENAMFRAVDTRLAIDVKRGKALVFVWANLGCGTST